mgnify:CR=1 FL=1
MENYTLRHTEERDGLTIKVYTTPALVRPDWGLSKEQRKQLLAEIESGRLEWISVKIIVEKKGIELAHDSLINCCYQSIGQFIRPDGYYSGMIDHIISEAKKILASLCD